MGGKTVDTSQYKKPGPYRLCFSTPASKIPGASLASGHAGASRRAEATSRRPPGGCQGKDDKQISDINSFVSGGSCDFLIVSPNTTAALTPAVEAACKKLPVMVFDRGVLTAMPGDLRQSDRRLRLGHPDRQFHRREAAEGRQGAGLRILPGVDVLETRWSAANRIFKEKGINVVGAEFTGGDNAKTKSIVEDYIRRFGNIDAIWMDAGATSVAAHRGIRGRGPAQPDHHRRRSGRLSQEMAEGKADRDCADLSDLSMAHADPSRASKSSRASRCIGAELETAAADHHPGRP